MKRVPPLLRRCYLIAALLFAWAPGLFGDCPQSDVDVILSWVKAVRRDAARGPVSTDSVLERAAGAYAAELAARGLLSHRDRGGRDALDRVQAAGGTSTLVGEILGSGLDPRVICAAWAASPTHRAVVENPLWTHVGMGCACLGARRVWVVLFTARRVSELLIERLPGREAGPRFRVSGRVEPGRALSPVLLSGLALLEPELWLPESGRFSYVIPPGRELVYHRLGFQDGEGGVTVTDAFYPAEAATSSPGTGPR